MNKRTAILGIILIVLGLIFWLNQLDVLDVSFGELLGFAFPLALIAVGAWLIFRGRRRGRHSASFTYDYQHYGRADQAGVSSDGSAETTGAEGGGHDHGHFGAHHGSRMGAMPSSGPSGKVRYDKFMGDLFIDCRDISLQNVEVSSFIGDVEVKLHGARLAPGLNRMVISGFVGDIRVLVPTDMQVFVQASNFVGDTELFGRRTTGFGNSLDAQTGNYANADSKLYIAVNCFIADVRVYEV